MRFLCIIAGSMSLFSAAYAQETAYVPIGAHWEVAVVKDAMTDQGRGIAVASGEDRASLIVKCDAGTADRAMYIQFSSPEYLGSLSGNQSRPMLIRFDSATPVESYWFHDGANAILTGPLVSNFVARLQSAERIAIRASDFRGASVNASIPVAGGREAIERAYSACGQSLPWREISDGSLQFAYPTPMLNIPMMGMPLDRELMAEGQPSADRFCQAVGHQAAVSFAVGPVKRGVIDMNGKRSRGPALQDVVCRD